MVFTAVQRIKVTAEGSERGSREKHLKSFELELSGVGPPFGTLPALSTGKRYVERLRDVRLMEML
jgi:hypothetical protein